MSRVVQAIRFVGGMTALVGGVAVLAPLVGSVKEREVFEKQGLERERRLMEQVQDGLNTMNEIIKGTKEQNQVNLSH